MNDQDKTKGQLVNELSELRQRIAELEAEEALRESEEKYRQLFATIPDAIVVFDADTRQFIDVNESALHLYGYTREEFLELEQKDITAEPDKSETSIEAMLRGELDRVPVRYHKKKDGSVFPVEISAGVFALGERRVVYGVIRDITERKQADEALRKSELRFRSLIEQTTDAVFCYEFDPPIPTDLPLEEQVKRMYDCVLVECNDVCARSYGATRAEDVVGKKLTQVFGTSSGSLDNLFTALVQSGYRITDGLGTEVLPDGTKRYYLNNGYGVVEDGRLLRVWGTFRDITESKEAEEALRTEKEFADTALDAQLDTFFLFEPATGKAVRWNRAFRDISGYSDEEIARMPAPASYYSPEDLDRAGAFTQRVLEEGIGTIEMELICKEGRKIPTEYRVSVINDDQGEPKYMIAIGRDIIERKQAEEALRESEFRLRSVIAQAHDGISLVDEQGYVVAWNQAMEKITGLEAQDVLNRPIWDVQFQMTDEEQRTPEVHAQLKAGLLEFLNTGRAPWMDRILEREYLRPDGQHLIIQGVVAAIETDRGFMLVSTSRDITERKWAEEALRESEERFRQMAENSRDVFWLRDLKSLDLLYITPAYERLWGQSIEDARTEPLSWMRSVHLEDRDRVAAAFEKQLRGEPTENEYRIVWPDGSVHWIRDRVTPILDEAGEAYRTFGIIEDITDRKQAEEALRESERKFRTLIENIVDWVWQVDPNGVYTYASPQAEKIMGYSVSEIIGKTPFHFMAPEEAERVGAIFSEIAARHGNIVGLEDTLIAKDGREVVFETNATPLFNGDGQFIGYMGTCRDITGPKQAEEALRESEERFRFAVSQTPGTLWTTDTELRFTLSEGAGLLALGLAPGQVVGMSLQEFFNTEDLDYHSIAMHRHALKGESVAYEDEFAGNYYTTRLEPLRDSQGRVTGVIGVSFDVTESRRAENLAHTQRQLAQALSAVTRLDEGLRICVEAALHVSGMDCGGVYLRDRTSGGLDLVFHQGFSPDFVSSTLHYDADSANVKLVTAGEPIYTQHQELGVPLDDAKQSERLGALAILPVRHEGRVIGCLNVASHTLDDVPDFARDALEQIATQIGSAIARLNAEEERDHLLTQVQEQSQQIKRIMDTVPEGVILLDTDGQVILANPVAEKDLTVLADAEVGDTVTHLGDRPLAELLASPPKGLWHEVAAGDRSFEVIARSVSEATEADPTLTGWVVVIRDVTQEREVEGHIQQQERLAAVGQLAAGIAHDFNNIMATIVLYAQMTERTPGLPDRIGERMRTIDEQAKHASNLIQQILDFSRRTVLERLPLDLVPFLKEQVQLLERTLPESITIGLDYATDEYTVDADPTRIQQMVMNLALNARDAMPEGGELRIGLERTEFESQRSLPLPEMETGEWIQMTVSDTGTGIPADVVPRIFDPFYTTKAPGEGSGLGLAQVHGIVGAHEGAIDVQSQVGQGTVFTIYLPALPAHPAETPTQTLQSLVEGRGEIILVVEDNAITREALVESLELLNYDVLEAANGQAALMMLEQHGEEIALVLSDVVMPELGGIALLHTLRERGLSIPVVMLTGHPLEREMEDLQAQGMIDWLSKPPRLRQLAEVVARALPSD